MKAEFSGIGHPGDEERRKVGSKAILRALVASASLETRNHIKSVMEGAGYRVAEAYNGLEALQVVQLSAPFDLILLDTELPALGSIEAAIQIRSLVSPKGWVPMLGLTEGEFEGAETRYLDAGFDAVFAKPIISEAFLKKCKQVIVNHAGSDQAGLAECDDWHDKTRPMSSFDLMEDVALRPRPSRLTRPAMSREDRG